MQRLLFICSIFLCIQAPGQHAYLFIKKHQKRIQSFPEGAYISLMTKDGRRAGNITLLRNDSLFLDGRGLHVREVEKVFLPAPAVDRISLTRVALSTAFAFGVAYFAAKHGSQTFAETATIMGVVTYGPMIRRLAKKHLKRSQYRIGKKFELQVFDLRPS